MPKNYGFSFHFVLMGLLTLATGCSQVSPMLPLGSPTPQAGQAPNVTLTSHSDQATVPTSTPAVIAETTRQVAPTVQMIETTPRPSSDVTPTPLPSLTVAPQPTPSLTPLPATFPPSISLEPVLRGFQLPVFVTTAGEEPSGISRLFVVEKAGRIHLVENGISQPAPFLDITDRVGSERNEQGLLSVAFPPDFATSGFFYVNYTDGRGDTVIARYGVHAGDPSQADPGSEQHILQIEQPAANHNGGQLQFGPDGYLYIGTGDGGQAGDPWGNAQNPNVLLGKMLRIDVRATDTYILPSDNPLPDQPGVRPEIWSTGLRNPWRFSFDRATGDLYIADVGQNRYEEVDFQPAASSGGENYGWDVMEGKHCFEPATNCDTTGLVLPVGEYDHSQGCSITGGYVYRGTRYPQMAGVYFFGDFCSGIIGGLRQKTPGEWEIALLLDTDLTISSFGEDTNGEIYVVDYGQGTIYHLAAVP